MFHFILFRRWSKGQQYPLTQRKSNFLFLRVLRSMGRQCATPCFLTLAHDPFLPAAKRVRFGDDVPPHAPLASPVLGPREFGKDASECTAFCTIPPYSLSLHHHRYVDCAVGAACTASGGVAHAAQPVSLAHAHKSTRLRNSVRQATSQVQRRSRDVGGSWRPPKMHDSRRCMIGVVLSFLQERLERRLSPSTLKCMWPLSRPTTMQWMAGPWESMISS